MDGRWFSKRLLTCEYYDGVTNYNVYYLIKNVDESFED
jgi:hypothetical protein